MTPEARRRPQQTAMLRARVKRPNHGPRAATTCKIPTRSSGVGDTRLAPATRRNDSWSATWAEHRGPVVERPGEREICALPDLRTPDSRATSTGTVDGRRPKMGNSYTVLQSQSRVLIDEVAALPSLPRLVPRDRDRLRNHRPWRHALGAAPTSQATQIAGMGSRSPQLSRYHPGGNLVSREDGARAPEGRPDAHQDR
jgi:hypothetical protein